MYKGAPSTVLRSSIGLIHNVPTFRLRISLFLFVDWISLIYITLISKYLFFVTLIIIFWSVIFINLVYIWQPYYKVYGIESYYKGKLAVIDVSKYFASK